MSRPLPPEIHDLIVDFLHDEGSALKACCVVSKSWVPRGRRHLFALIVFHAHPHTHPHTRPPQIHQWVKTFPDPSKSPAHYTRSLVICGSLAAIAPNVSWIRAFSDIAQLRLDADDGPHLSLISLRGFSRTLKSLHLSYRSSLPPSETFGFVCSFPLLEDLFLVPPGNDRMIRKWSIPSTSPKFTGTLDLRPCHGMNTAVRYLVQLPDGLRFTEIRLFFASRDAEAVTNLLSNCSETLESLRIGYFMTCEFSLLASTVGQCLITTCEHSPGYTFD